MAPARASPLNSRPAPPSPFHSPPPGPLSALRSATRAHHDRIDRLMNVARMRERGHYVRVLQVLDAFLGSWEDAVAAALPARWRAWLHGRSRRAWLQQDLRVLGAAPLGGPVAVPELATPAAAWGSLYVMEGSALGGQVITRELARVGLHPAAGAAYFHGFGPATGAMWREFRALLETELAPAERIPPACEAARQTFDQLSLLLEQALHERTPAA